MKNNIIIALALLVACTFASCKDDWDSHFGKGDNLSDKTLYELIREDSDLSTFAGIIEAVGYDTILTSSQTYTVWAPVNSALEQVDMNDKDELLRLVKNHIGRYTNSTSTPVTQGIYMLNGKLLNYTGSGEFAGVALIGGDVISKNGLLHKLKGMIPYKYNIFEYMSTHSNYSEIYNFVNSFYEKKYSESLSTAYDSVYIDYNRLMETLFYGIGAIQKEDSVFTMILPDNQAWQSAYNRISPYFTNYSKLGKPYMDSVQKVQTSLAILQGLTFRGKIEAPFSQYDTLVTSMENIGVGINVIRDPAGYFTGLEKIEASNGLIYPAVGTIKISDIETWNPVLEVESEYIDGRTSVTGTSAYIRNVDANSLVSGVSGNSYLEVSASSTEAGVTFEIPNTLAGKYDVYVDFVAPMVDGIAFANEKTRVQFQLNYIDANGRSQKVSNTSKDLIVGGTGTADKIRLKVWSATTLPVSNYYDNMWYLDETHSAADIVTTTSLLVRTNVTRTELNKELVRKFRIDKIILVPVN